ncbi:MAG: tRNA (uridine(34)/cytosine(34)/5-carboxymethylaminomethyluridine(34)-2'-O)-methyltransferase TrmL [Gammaproteobacteria bacterium]|nr:MAG: tRNA (uridine(34)/cytosine(34)/5-carboxymethylaminomethyluridine(34)-2'-O)-methyltransferase TrmL [Gammaproteobacteria bacterium]
MLHIALYEPEIPPNTGNIIRLAANTGAQLHLIKPLGFELDNKRLQRAGLDYHEYADIKIYDNFTNFITDQGNRRVFAVTSKGTVSHHLANYEADDVFLFGPETRGLPESIRRQLGADQCIRLPMLKDSRSLNLSNAVAVVIYEAWRQLHFNGAEF